MNFFKRCLYGYLVAQEHLGNDASDLDIALPAGTGDAGFLTSLADHLPSLLDTFQPDLVLYDAGVDP